jgi:hypothetical protein
LPLSDPSLPLNYIIHRGDEKDPGPDQSFIPEEDASVWIMSMDETVYGQRGAAQNFATLHYRRPAGEYGDYTSTNYVDFWGLHTWLDADDPGWTSCRQTGSILSARSSKSRSTRTRCRSAISSTRGT